MNVYEQIVHNRAAGRKMIAVLLDPDKCPAAGVGTLCRRVSAAGPDFVFVGGSGGVQAVDGLVASLKARLSVPVVLFPGSAAQFSARADALLFLTLISGRNPEMLIGQQVSAALAVRRSGIEAIPMGYMLVDGGRPSSVERVSGTRPIGRDALDEAVATAVAGELLGLRLLYLEAGSGALQPVPAEMVRRVRQAVSVPLIAGGGVRTVEQLHSLLDAGADLVVVGNHFERHPEEMAAFCREAHGISGDDAALHSGRRP